MLNIYIKWFFKFIFFVICWASIIYVFIGLPQYLFGYCRHNDYFLCGFFKNINYQIIYWHFVISLIAAFTIITTYYLSPKYQLAATRVMLIVGSIISFVLCTMIGPVKEWSMLFTSVITGVVTVLYFNKSNIRRLTRPSSGRSR